MWVAGTVNDGRRSPVLDVINLRRAAAIYTRHTCIHGSHSRREREDQANITSDNVKVNIEGIFRIKPNVVSQQARAIHSRSRTML